MEFNATLTVRIISWLSLMHLCVLGFLTQVPTTFFSKSLTTCIRCIIGNSKQEGHEAPVLLHWPIGKIPLYQTLQYFGIGLKHWTPKKD